MPKLGKPNLLQTKPFLRILGTLTEKLWWPTTFCYRLCKLYVLDSSSYQHKCRYIFKSLSKLFFTAQRLTWLLRLAKALNLIYLGQAQDFWAQDNPVKSQLFYSINHPKLVWFGINSRCWSRAATLWQALASKVSNKHWTGDSMQAGTNP